MLELGHEVAGNDTLIGGYLDNVPKEAEFHQLDCCDVEGMTKAIAGSDIVIHAAATAHEANRRRCNHFNCDGCDQ